MHLYLDLSKAVGQVPSVGREGATGAEARRDYLESFDTRYAGEGNNFGPDDPSVGSRPSGGATVRDAVNDLEDADAEDLSDRGVIPAKEDDKNPPPPTVEKSIDLLQSLNKSLEADIAAQLPNPLEIEFLLHKGISPLAIDRGTAHISGRMRDEFQAWLQTRLLKSVLALRENL